MATSLTPDVKNEEWTESGVLLGAFLSLVVNDYPLRTLIAGN